MNEKEITKKKAEFFYDKRIQVHIEVNRTFYNGEIIELCITEGVIVLQDRILGKKYLFLDEITKLEEYNGTTKKNNLN
jgi:hypothetical protein